jgi:hypothetical protein
MGQARMMNRLQAGNPVSAEHAERQAGAQWAAALRERLLATNPDAREERRQKQRPWPVIAAAALALAGGGTVAANEFRAEVAPNTPAGERYVQDLFQRFRELAPTPPAGGLSNFAPDPKTARVVFSARTRYGEYTIWHARTDGPLGRALLFSSPRNGVNGSFGGPSRLPRAPYITIEGGAASRMGGAREFFGRVSPGIRRVRVDLPNGGRARAIVANGWFLFTQDFGHAKPVRLVGLDRHGHVVATYTKGLS